MGEENKILDSFLHPVKQSNLFGAGGAGGGGQPTNPLIDVILLNCLLFF